LQPGRKQLSVFGPVEVLVVAVQAGGVQVAKHGGKYGGATGVAEVEAADRALSPIALTAAILK
jgi:hypothetical protein